MLPLKGGRRIGSEELGSLEPGVLTENDMVDFLFCRLDLGNLVHGGNSRWRYRDVLGDQHEAEALMAGE